MSVGVRIKTNTFAVDLKKRIAKAKDTEKALEAAGLVVVSMAKRAFNDEDARPGTWEPLKPATIAEKKRAGKSSAILKRDGVLAKSPRVIEVTKTKVTIGTDRAYAAVQQFGSSKSSGRGSGIPARPFFPFDLEGNITTKGRQSVEKALIKSLDLTGD
jgi:phage gpG-like protein